MIRDPDLTRWLVCASVVLSAVALAFVLADVRRPDGDPLQMKPELVSWGIWAVLQAEGSVAALRAGNLPTGAYGLACAAGCAVVAGLGWRTRTWNGLSRGCAGVAAGCLVLMIVVSDPELVIGLTVAADLAAFAPTIGHAWAYPGEESWLGYGFYGLGAWAGLAVAAVTMTGMTYLAYLTVADTMVPVMIVARRKALARRTAANLASANAAATAQVLARVTWPPEARGPEGSVAWEPVTGLVWETEPGAPAQEPATVVRWRPRRPAYPAYPAYPPPGPWTYPSGPL